jgi:hypothetical protein
VENAWNLTRTLWYLDMLKWKRITFFERECIYKLTIFYGYLEVPEGILFMRSKNKRRQKENSEAYFQVWGLHPFGTSCVPNSFRYI